MVAFSIGGTVHFQSVLILQNSPYLQHDVVFKFLPKVRNLLLKCVFFYLDNLPELLCAFIVTTD